MEKVEQFGKIKKVLAKIEQEKTKEVQQIIKRAATIKKDYGQTILFDSAGAWLWRIDGVLTERQQQKTLKEQKQILFEKAQKAIKKRFAKNFEELEATKEEDTPNKIEIVVDWVKNRTWGYNPHATLWTDNGARVEGETASGCGYDKRSAATASVLNSPQIKKVVFEKLEKLPQNKIYKMLKSGEGSRDFWGYGLGTYGGGSLPYFDGGVGVECRIHNLEKLGYKCVTNRQPDNGSDIFLFVKKGVKI